ncbi:hypothetical protein [Chryseobacterium koreense]|uniref:hypothetical protein n=1 Tax=Chryseobacterium koreense TaxID=232216 RepID=UPI0019D3A6C5
MVDLQAEIFTDGIVRFQLKREDIPPTPRLRGAFMVNTDKEYGWPQIHRYKEFWYIHTLRQRYELGCGTYAEFIKQVIDKSSLVECNR